MTEQTPAVQLKKVSKQFPLYGSQLRQMLGYLGFAKRNVPYKLALDNISLTIGHGECVGIVGHNGSGKTTLLRTIIGFTRATSGQVLVDGSIQALMQTGYGFNDDLTGLENIRIALTYNDLKGPEASLAEEDIINFVELGEFLHHPLKTYSLGMRARLEFAAATAIKPDVLAIDEVLGAGDGYFVRKCAQRMRDLVSDTTLLLVSHSLDQIREYCERVIWMDAGKIREDGPTDEVLTNYRTHMAQRTEQLHYVTTSITNNNHEQIHVKARAFFNVPPESPADTLYLSFAETENAMRVIETGDPLALRLSVHTQRTLEPVVLGLSEQGAFIFELSVGLPLNLGKQELLLRHPCIGVGVGNYVLIPALREPGTGQVVALGPRMLSLQIAQTNWSDPPLVHLDGQWIAGADMSPIKSKISAWV